MTRSLARPFRTAAGAALLAMATSGCLDYTFETTLRADGTGARVERMEFTRNDDFDLTPGEVQSLTAATTGRGWTTSTRIDEDGDTTWVVERRREVTALSGWAESGAPPLILGTLPRRADERVGWIRLGDVAYRTTVQVRTSRRSDGASSLAYHETFAWTRAADAIIEILLRDVDAELARRYPRLDPADRGAIVGYARARLRTAGDEGLFRDENTEALRDAWVAEVASHAHGVVGARHPDARLADLRALFAETMEVDDDDTARTFDELLPGLTLGFNTSIVVRLTLPGTVTDTNAHTREGNTLEWRFSPLDDLGAPLELRAEAVIGG